MQNKLPSDLRYDSHTVLKTSDEKNHQAFPWWLTAPLATTGPPSASPPAAAPGSAPCPQEHAAGQPWSAAAPGLGPAAPWAPPAPSPVPTAAALLLPPPPGLLDVHVLPRVASQAVLRFEPQCSPPSLGRAAWLWALQHCQHPVLTLPARKHAPCVCTATHSLSRQCHSRLECFFASCHPLGPLLPFLARCGGLCSGACCCRVCSSLLTLCLPCRKLLPGRQPATIEVWVTQGLLLVGRTVLLRGALYVVCMVHRMMMTGVLSVLPATTAPPETSASSTLITGCIYACTSFLAAKRR